MQEEIIPSASVRACAQCLFEIPTALAQQNLLMQLTKVTRMNDGRQNSLIS